MNQQMPGESIHPRLRTAFRRRKAEYPNSHYLYYDTAGGRMQSHFTIFPALVPAKEDMASNRIGYLTFKWY